MTTGRKPRDAHEVMDCAELEMDEWMRRFIDDTLTALASLEQYRANRLHQRAVRNGLTATR